MLLRHVDVDGLRRTQTVPDVRPTGVTLGAAIELICGAVSTSRTGNTALRDAATGIFASYLARMRGRVLRGKRPGPPWPRPAKQSIAASLPPPVRGQHIVLSHAVARALGRSASGVHALDRILRPTRAADGMRCYDIERVLWLANILENMP